VFCQYLCSFPAGLPHLLSEKDGKQIVNLNDQISHLVESSKTEREQIAQSTAAVGQIGKDSETLAESIKKETDAARGISRKLAVMSDKIQHKVGDAARSTEFVFEASKQAGESVERNSKGLDALDGNIKRFKIRQSP
jgi:methyl-accepting chemotaxis protein